MAGPFIANSSSVDVTLGAVGSSPNANGAALSGQVLTLQPADGTNPGVLTAGAQTIGGAKTFSGAISASNLSGTHSGTHSGTSSNTNTGDVTLAAMGSAANANGATLTGQVLNLQPASASFAGALPAADKSRLDGALSKAARLLSFENIAAKSATGIHASFAGNNPAVKAELDLDTPSAALDTIVEATTAGAAGNDITIAGAADSAPAAGVTISRIGTAFIIHFEDGVSTVTNVETAIAALAGGDDLFGTKTGGTGATVLTSADAFAATALAGGASGNDFPGAFSNPAYPRNVSVVAAAGWDGGNVTITGTGPDDAALEETIIPVGASTVYGVKLFKTVTSAVKATVGASADGASIGTGDKLWLGAGITPTSAFGMLAQAGTSEAVTIDTTYKAWTPTTAPDGSKDFVLLVNL